MSSIKTAISQDDITDGVQDSKIDKMPSNEAIKAAADCYKENHETLAKQTNGECEDADEPTGKKGIRRRKFSEAEEHKPVVERGLKGRVKWFSVGTCYGFIERYDGKGDVFVHQTGILKSNIRTKRYRSLAESEEVIFDLVDGRRGIEAANVCGADGGAVVGVPIMIFFKENRRIIREGASFIHRPLNREGRSKPENIAKGDAQQRPGNGVTTKSENPTDVQGEKKGRRRRGRRRHNKQRKDAHDNSETDGNAQVAGGTELKACDENKNLHKRFFRPRRRRLASEETQNTN